MSVRTIDVDWPRCAAAGRCHELLPELIDLDSEGYPVITGEVSPQLLRGAKDAIGACPRQALFLV